MYEFNYHRPASIADVITAAPTAMVDLKHFIITSPGIGVVCVRL